MLNLLDTFLDQITMYRLTLYVLIAYLGIACILGFLGLVSYSPQNIFLTSLMLVGSMWIVNKVCSQLLKVPTNVESVYITALILACILTPATTVHERLLVLLTGVIAVLSKFLVSWKKKHVFNPAALAVVISSYAYGYFASWWVGTAWMLPITLIGGFLILRKLQRMHMAISFLTVSCFFAILFGLPNNPLQTLRLFFLDSASIFFATIMLTEPLTIPPTLTKRIVYGALTGFLFTPQIHIGQVFATPELALIVGNIYSYIVSSKKKLMLTLKEKIKVGKDQIDFILTGEHNFVFQPGQYMEWTLPHPQTDSRGNRRYFTLASSPTEDEFHLGVKFYPQGSSYKRALVNFSSRDTIVAGSLSGDFTLPKDKSKKLVFLAGGIGITPFRSMVKYLLDKGEKRNIVLLYSNRLASEIMYADIWNQADRAGVKVVYTLTDLQSLPANWQAEVGRITPDMIQKEIPDYKSRLFYLSGPHSMVAVFEKVLQAMGIPHSQIKKDFFPGFV